MGTKKAKFIVILALCGLFLGCSYQTKLRKVERRIERLTKKFPELLKKDTITVRDTTILDSILTDSLFGINFDTIFIENDRASIRLIRVKDTIYARLEAKTDTITMEKVIYRDKIVIQELNWWQKNNWWLIPLLVILIILTLLRVFRERLFTK